jgi:DNA topoisomerase-1
MRLIVTEKNNSAKKIAEILSGGSAAEGASYKTPFYTWSDENGHEQMTIGLKGHVLNPAFPESYNNWQETNPRDLIDAELIKEPTDKNVVRALKKVAKDADDIVIATDYDREGELIGLEALEAMIDANPKLVGANGSESDDDALATRPRIERARLIRGCVARASPSDPEPLAPTSFGLASIIASSASRPISSPSRS